MRAGRLDKRIIIQSKSVLQNGSGQPIESWSNLAEVWAQELPMRGGERFQAQQINGSAVMTFKIRYLTGLSVLNRIIYDGKTWDIHDIRRIGRKEALEIDASARAE